MINKNVVMELVSQLSNDAIVIRAVAERVASSWESESGKLKRVGGSSKWSAISVSAIPKVGAQVAKRDLITTDKHEGVLHPVLRLDALILELEKLNKRNLFRLASLKLENLPIECSDWLMAKTEGFTNPPAPAPAPTP